MPDAPPDGDIEVLFRGARSPTNPAARYPGFRPEETLRRAGTVLNPGSRPLTCDIRVSQDVGVGSYLVEWQQRGHPSTPCFARLVRDESGELRQGRRPRRAHEV